MSRIGKKPVSVPAGVKITLDPRSRGIGIEGPKGKLAFTYRPEVTVTWDESEKRVVCSIPQEQVRIGQIRAYWGTTRAIIQNMVVGVTEGFSKRLEVVGVGWGAKAQGRTLQLNVGYSHPVDLPVPQGVEVAVEGSFVSVSGADRQVVGQFAAEVRATRPPEPYNGKGIKYVGEIIIRKQGKVFGT